MLGRRVLIAYLVCIMVLLNGCETLFTRLGSDTVTNDIQGSISILVNSTGRMSPNRDDFEFFSHYLMGQRIDEFQKKYPNAKVHLFSISDFHNKYNQYLTGEMDAAEPVDIIELTPNQLHFYDSNQKLVDLREKVYCR